MGRELKCTFEYELTDLDIVAPPHGVELKYIE